MVCHKNIKILNFRIDGHGSEVAMQCSCDMKKNKSNVKMCV